MQTQRTRRRRGAVGLGSNQKMVLWLLSNERDKSVAQMEYDRMPGLDEPAIRTAIRGLERRGLIDVVDVRPGGYGSDRMVRHYGLTSRGREAVATITGYEEDDDE